MILAHRQAARAALEAQRAAEAPPIEPNEPVPTEAPPSARAAAKPTQQPRR